MYNNTDNETYLIIIFFFNFYAHSRNHSYCMPIIDLFNYFRTKEAEEEVGQFYIIMNTIN